MNNFNTGDKVRRVSPVCPTTKRATGIQKDGIYTVGESYGRGITLEESYQITFTFTAANFELVAAMGDDELPPAPKSVRYYHWGYHGINADAYLDVYSGAFVSGPRIRIKDKDNQGITINADAALQLAHDLTRMAMEIKRKEK